MAPGRRRGFKDDQFSALELGRDPPGCRFNVAQVGRTVLAEGGGNGNDVGLRRGRVRGGLQVTLAHSPSNVDGQIGLHKRYLAAAHGIYGVLVYVHAHNVDPVGGQNRGRRQANVAQPDNRNSLNRCQFRFPFLDSDVFFGISKERDFAGRSQLLV